LVRLRTLISYLAELAGFACLVYAGYLIAPALALLVLGVGLIAGAQVAGRR
jgi:hypothetical protein